MKVAASVTKDEAKKVERMVHKCLRLLARKDYYLGFDYTAAKKHASYCLRVFRRTNGRSNAGANNISINMSCWQFGNNAWKEYARLNNDPTIGSIRVGSDDDILMILVAHEVAHYVQRRYVPSLRTARHVRALDDKPHGERFKYVYRILRRDLVNPAINEKVIA